MSLLRVEGLTKRFGGVVALWRCSLEVQPGEVHALIGPNGAGKITLTNLVAGVFPPDEGRIHLCGQEVTSLPAYRRALLGIARTFQVTNLFPHDTVLENLRLAVQACTGGALGWWRPVDSEAELREEAESFAARVGLLHRLHVPASRLSHGERRQLEVGVALAGRPRLLLLDEPTSGMSAEESRRTVELIQELRGEAAILLVEHDMDVVFRVADRTTVLVDGRVLASGPPEEVRSDREVHRAYLGEVERRRVERPIQKGKTVSPGHTLLKVEGLQAAYGTSQVLFGVDLEVREGQVVTL